MTRSQRELAEVVELFDKPPAEDAPPNPFALSKTGAILARPTQPYRVKRLLPLSGTFEIFGDTGTGKTFWTIGLLAAMARGLPHYRGRKVTPSRVLWCCLEGMAKPRIQAYEKEHGVCLNDFPFHVLEVAPDLAEAQQVKLMAAAIAEVGGVDVAVLDTLSASMSGVDSDPKDAAKFLASVRYLKRTVPLVGWTHHVGLVDKERSRGWSGIRQSIDTQIRIDRDGELFDCVRIAEVTKIRDGRGQGDRYAFKLVEHVIGKDEDGEEETSCVDVPTDEVAAPKRGAEKPQRPGGAVQTQMLKAFKELVAGGGRVDIEQMYALTSEKLGREVKGGNLERARDGLVARELIFPAGVGYVSATTAREAAEPDWLGGDSA